VYFAGVRRKRKNESGEEEEHEDHDHTERKPSWRAAACIRADSGCPGGCSRAEGKHEPIEFEDVEGRTQVVIDRVFDFARKSFSCAVEPDLPEQGARSEQLALIRFQDLDNPRRFANLNVAYPNVAHPGTQFVASYREPGRSGAQAGDLQSNPAFVRFRK